MSVHIEEIVDTDIYRGEPPNDTAPSIRSHASVSSSTSSSSSSSSSLGGAGRLGAIASKLEHAISRWARNVRGTSVSSASSSSSSSSSSCSSVVTLTKSQVARRRRKTTKSHGASSLHTMHSERDIAARIERMKALEKSRLIRREFKLYLPPGMIPSVHQAPMLSPSTHIPEMTPGNRRVTHTTSLPLVLAQLDLAMRIRGNRQGRHRRGRPQKGQQVPATATIGEEPPGQGSEGVPKANQQTDTAIVIEERPWAEFQIGEPQEQAPPVRRRPKSHSPSPRPLRGRKGKHRASPGPTSRRRDMMSIPEEQQVPVVAAAPPRSAAWFLDVANPTWADLRAIGKVLHIHPLTLEDILQQDPREKLEIFSKLGYYFISFRAIESRETRARVQAIRLEAAVAAGFPEEKDITSESDGVNGIGEANVYLAVFKDGICCFHFTDVSEHTDRVRNRLVLLEEVVNMSADWIAHDILDSVVDSFFPFLEEIDKEVTAIDNIVYLAVPDNNNEPPAKSPVRPSAQSQPQPAPPSVKSSPTSQNTIIVPSYEPPYNEKATPAEKLRDAYRRPQFVGPRLTPPLLLRRVKRALSSVYTRVWTRCWPWTRASGQPPTPSATQMNLRRMARTRKLVTVLGRLLGTKSDVVTQIRKRLARAAAGAAAGASEDLEVAIYMGDVQDHILTLQHSLAHYERMLSQSHPTYLMQLRSKLDRSKGDADMNLLYLTIVSIAALCIQPLIGVFSINVKIPANNLQSGPFFMFGTVLALAALILVGFLALVRYWWKTAKRKRRREL